MPHPAYLMMKLPLIALALWLILQMAKGRPVRLLVLPWRFIRWLFLAVLIGLAGCSHTEQLAEAKGPLFALNPDHWQAAPDDLKDPPQAGQ